MSKWPTVSLREVISLDLQKEPIDSSKTYEMVGVLSYGRGLFRRPAVKDGQTSYSYMLRLKAEHVVMSQLFGWEGALALSSPEFDGAYLSPNFPTFLVDEKRLDRKFLGWVMQQPSFWQDLGNRAKGMGDRRRTLNPEALFQSTIPFPPLPEQRAIVAKLDELSDKTTQLNAHLDAIEADADALVLSLHNQLSGSSTVALSDVIELHEESITIESDKPYPQVGVRSFGGGLFAKPAITGAETSYRRFNRLYEDAFVLSQVKGWEGAIALTPPELVGMYASPEYRTFRCLPGRASPQYLLEIIKCPWFWSLLQDATRGVGARRERTRPEQFLNVVLPMPEYDRQLEGAQIFKNLAALRAKYIAIHQSNTALVPATLERIFGERRAPVVLPTGTATGLRLHSEVAV